jgi:glycerol-3-phosphate dehydrogenase
MAEELKWTRSEKRKQIERAVHFLGTMGLAPDAVHVPEPVPKGLLENLGNMAWRACGGIVGIGNGRGVKRGAVYSRAQFEAGEVAALKEAFLARARKVGSDSVDAGKEAQRKVRKEELAEILKAVPGYERIQTQDYEYVFEEAGFKNLQDVSFDEFVEVSCRIHLQVAGGR